MTTTILNTKIVEVERKIPDVSSLAKETDYNSKKSGIEGKFFTSSDFNKITSGIVNVKIKQKK